MPSNLIGSVTLYLVLSFAISVVAYVVTIPAGGLVAASPIGNGSGALTPKTTTEDTERSRSVQSEPGTTSQSQPEGPAAKPQPEQGNAQVAPAEEDDEQTMKRFAYEFLVAKAFNPECDKSRWYSMYTAHESGKVWRTYYEIVNPLFEVDSESLSDVDRNLNKYQFSGSVTLTGNAHRIYREGRWENYTEMKFDWRYRAPAMRLSYVKRDNRWVHRETEGLDGRERPPCHDVIPNLLPSFMTEELSEKHLSGLSQEHLKALYNYILARHGAVFSQTTPGDAEAWSFFQGRPWYRPRRDLSYEQILAELTPLERTNLTRIAEAYDKKKLAAETGREP